MEIEFLYNATLLVTLSVFSSLLGEKLARGKRAEPWWQGLLFGLAALLVMRFPVRLESGVFFDGRTVILGMAAWFFGPVTVGIAALPAILYRLWIGGPGVGVGIVSILFATGYGWAAHVRFPPAKRLPSLKELLLFGVSLHLVVAALFFVLISVEVGRAVAPFFLIYYPVATVLCGAVLTHEKTRQNLLETLRVQEEQLRLITHHMRDVLTLMRLSDRKIVYVSPSNVHFTGYTPEEAMTRSLEEILTPDSLKQVNEWLANEGLVESMSKDPRPEGGNPLFQVEERCKDGGTIITEMSVSVLCDAKGRPEMMLGVSRDITGRVKQEEALRESEAKHREMYRLSQEVGERLQHSLEEKDVLLKEVHHRVKNNLQVVSSLLRLESGRVEVPQARLVLEDMRQRVRSMAMLHEALYLSENLARADMAPYLERLARHIEASADAGGRVRLSIELENVQLDLDRSIACGLLANELLSNAFKHGFPPPRAGEVTLRFSRVPESETLLLEVENDGEGLPEDFETRGRESLGIQLAHDFTRQLNGKMEIRAFPTPCFSIRFPFSL